MVLIYEPKEDSFLLSNCILKNINSKDKILEIGCGSGYQLDKLFEFGIKKENIFAVDINKDAVKKCKEKGYNVLKSYLFEKVSGKFNIIIFNPPYLPEDEFEDEESKLITTAGKFGDELINEFLNEAKDHLEKNGKIFLITSSLSKKPDFSKYKVILRGEKKLFFEKLFCWELNLKI